VPRVPGGVSTLRFQLTLFRSALYSALYRRDFGASDPPDVSSLPPLLFSSEFRWSPDRNPSVSTCAARPWRLQREGGREVCHALLITEVGSDEERRAMTAVLPAVQHCLQENNELRFGRGMLRGMLAEALYKLRKAASTPAAL